MDNSRSKLYQELLFITNHLSSTYFENTKKTKQIITTILINLKLEAERKALQYNPAEVDERDKYCLLELNRQLQEQHHGRHERLLSHAILITAYSSFEHLVTTLARHITPKVRANPKKKIYLKDALDIIAEIDITLNSDDLIKIDTLRIVRNIIAHANGEYLNQNNDDIEKILNNTKSILLGPYGTLDIQPEYIDQALDTIERLIKNLESELRNHTPTPISIESTFNESDWTQ
ncbi:hypothetical protein [Pseudomonas putida]|uniref:hypothetical protein n=1 Tax=Pseudomonas TaxID=286 RepID=UPI003467D1A4